MDAINLGIRSLIPHGGSSCIAVPPIALKNIGNPTRFEVVLNDDKSIRLVPIYTVLLYLSLANLIVSASVVAVAFS